MVKKWEAVATVFKKYRTWYFDKVAEELHWELMLYSKTLHFIENDLVPNAVFRIILIVLAPINCLVNGHFEDQVDLPLD